MRAERPSHRGCFASPQGEDLQAWVLLLGWDQSCPLMWPLLSTAGKASMLLGSGSNHFLQCWGFTQRQALHSSLRVSETQKRCWSVCTSLPKAVSRL